MIKKFNFFNIITLTIAAQIHGSMMIVNLRIVYSYPVLFFIYKVYQTDYLIKYVLLVPLIV